MFHDTPEGQTHSYGDGCIPPHEPVTQDTPEPVKQMVETLHQGKYCGVAPDHWNNAHFEGYKIAQKEIGDWLTTHATTLYNDAYNAGKERAERSKYVQNLVNDAVREGVKAEREKWATRLPEDTVQVTVEARVGSNVLANRKFAHVESIQLSSGTVLHTVASEAVSEILHEIIHPHPTHR